MLLRRSFLGCPEVAAREGLGRNSGPFFGVPGGALFLLALPERGAKRRPLMIYWLVLLGAMLIRLYFAVFPLELARLQNILAIIAVFVGMGLAGNALLSVCAQFILKKHPLHAEAWISILVCLLLSLAFLVGFVFLMPVMYL